MSFLTYNERCARLVLDRLELYRLHCGLITSFKSNYGFNCLRSEDFFTLCGKQITRGHPFELLVKNYRIDTRKCFFNLHVVTIWNQLPAAIFNVVTVPAFAAKLCWCNLSHYLL